MVGAKSLIHSQPPGPTLLPFHRLTLLMHMSQKASVVADCISNVSQKASVVADCITRGSLISYIGNII